MNKSPTKIAEKASLTMTPNKVDVGLNASPRAKVGVSSDRNTKAPVSAAVRFNNANVWQHNKTAAGQVSAKFKKLQRKASKSAFGGSLLKGHPKAARPVSRHEALHLVLKSELARGDRSFLLPKRARKLEAIIRKQASKTGVRIYSLVNVGNHFHLVIRLALPSMKAAQCAYKRFIRAVTGLIAREVLKSQRGAAKRIRFWQARPFTRIVSRGWDYNNVIRYMRKNRDDAAKKREVLDWGFTWTSMNHIIWLGSG